LHQEEGSYSLVKAQQGNVQEIDAVHKFVNMPESLNKVVCGGVESSTNPTTNPTTKCYYVDAKNRRFCYFFN
jgi:hypothetical protein